MKLKFAMNWERIGIIRLDGGYRAWWIRYSWGVMVREKPKVLWCWPRFEHCDVRNLLADLAAAAKEEKGL